MAVAETTILGKLSAPVAKWVILGLLMAFGAFANALVRLQKAREQKRPFDKWDVFIAFFLACFAGLLYALMSEWFGMDNMGQRIATMLGSFGGMTAINKAVEFFDERVGLRGKK